MGDDRRSVLLPALLVGGGLLLIGYLATRPAASGYSRPPVSARRAKLMHVARRSR